MKTIVAPINGENYYFKVGFEVVSFVVAELQDENVADNPGRMAWRTLRLASQDNHPGMDWPEFIEGLPMEGWTDVWVAFESVMAAVEETAPAEENSPPIDMAADSYIRSMGGRTD